MPYNFVADIFHTKKLCSRLSSSEVRFHMENGRFGFLSPFLGSLRATYDDHLRLIGKHVVDFPLVLIELFFARGWSTTSEYRFKISDFTPMGPVDPKFQVEGVAPHQPFFSQKTRLNDLLSGQIFLPFRHTRLTDGQRQTDGHTDRQMDRQLSPD